MFDLTRDLFKDNLSTKVSFAILVKFLHNFVLWSVLHKSNNSQMLSLQLLHIDLQNDTNQLHNIVFKWICSEICSINYLRVCPGKPNKIRIAVFQEVYNFTVLTHNKSHKLEPYRLDAYML